MIPLWLPKLIAIAAGLIFVLVGEARARAKALVIAALVVSLVLQHGWGTLATRTAGLVIQVIVAVAVLIYFRLPR